MFERPIEPLAILEEAETLELLGLLELWGRWEADMMQDWAVKMVPVFVEAGTPNAMLLCHMFEEKVLELVLVPLDICFCLLLGMSWSICLSGSLIRAMISVWAWRMASAEPLMVMCLSACPFCLSISICAPDTSRIALMLHPALPITLLTAFKGTVTFLVLENSDLQVEIFNKIKNTKRNIKEMCVGLQIPVNSTESSLV